MARRFKSIGGTGKALQNRNRFRAGVDSREPKRVIFSALMGNGEGGDIRTNCRIEDDPNRVYVRSIDRGVMQAVLNIDLPARHDLPILVGVTQENPDVYEVLGLDNVYINGLGNYSYVPHHHQAHEFRNANGGDDVVWNQKQQFLPFLGAPTDPVSMGVYVRPEFYLYLTAWQYFPGGIVDLTGHLPAAGFVRYVLISVNAVTNVLALTDGADFSAFPPSNPATHIPQCPARHFPIAAVYLTDVATEVTWDELYDVRLMVGGGVNTTVPGPHHLIDVIAHDDTVAWHAPVEGDLIYANADTPSAWDALAIGTSYQLLMVNAAGTLPYWRGFDWDLQATAAGADMVHHHSSNAEGGTYIYDVNQLGLSDNAWDCLTAINYPNLPYYSYVSLDNVRCAWPGTTVTSFDNAWPVSAYRGSIRFVDADTVAFCDAPKISNSGNVRTAANKDIDVTRHPYLFVRSHWDGRWYEIGWSGASGGMGAHNLLSATHGDTVAATPPGEGSLIRGNAANEWAELLHPGRDGYVLSVDNDTSLWMPRVYVYNHSVTYPDTYYGVYSSHTKLGGITDLNDNYYGHYGRMEVNQSDSVLGVLYGGFHESALTSGQVNFLIGHQSLATMDAGVYVYSVAEADYVYGGYSVADLNEGVVYGDVVGHFVNVDAESAVVIGGSIYGLVVRVDNDSDAPTACMVYLDELTDIDWGIYQNGTAMHYFGGHVGIGVEPGTARVLHVEDTLDLDAGGVFGINAALFSDPAGLSSANISGIQATARTAAGNAQNFTGYLTGLNCNVRHQGTGVLDDAWAVLAQVRNTSTGTVTWGRGLYVLSAINSGGGTITNLAGLYIAAQSVGTNNWGVYQAGNENNYFGGPISAVFGDYWELEDYHAGAPTPDGYVRVDINGVTYKLAAELVP